MPTRRSLKGVLVTDSRDGRDRDQRRRRTVDRRRWRSRRASTTSRCRCSPWSSRNCAFSARSQRVRTSGPESSLLKTRGTELQQAITELALEASGYYAAPFDASTPERGRQLSAGRTELRQRRGAGLLQHAQGLDLRWIQRDPAQHHVEAGVGVGLNRQRSFSSSISSNGVPTACSSMKRTSTCVFDQPRFLRMWSCSG